MPRRSILLKKFERRLKKRDKMGDKRLIITMLCALILTVSVVSALVPTGGSLTEIGSERAQADTAQSDSAFAGNMTEMNIVGYSTTQTWQGYFGNVTGTIQLADSNDDVLYNWTLANPQGEVYASVQGSVDWTALMCFNFTADNTRASDSLNIGNTSMYGMNLVALEAAYGITSDDVDGVDETFSLTGTHEYGGGFDHTMFYSNSLQFTAGECLSTHLRGNNGAFNDSNFEEILLYDYVNEDPIFVSLIDDSVSGFDGAARDFEMLVLEDGHGTDISTTDYYFYVELE
jgi:hypothetical protein